MLSYATFSLHFPVKTLSCKTEENYHNLAMRTVNYRKRFSLEMQDNYRGFRHPGTTKCRASEEKSS